jgi:copper chaperone CopZ
MFSLLQLQTSMTITKKTFHVLGMHCDACVQRIQPLVTSLDPLAKVYLQPPSIEISSTISLEQVRQALKDLDSYHIHEEPSSMAHYSLKTFLPLILIFLGLLLLCVWGQVSHGSWSTELAMKQFMAGFFIIFSSFKLINLRGFVDSYRSYDLLAQQWSFYGWAYPFIELALGFAYALGGNFPYLNLFTLVLMIFSALGVYRTLISNRKISCACLGTVIKLPMTWITFGEDLLMALMALAMMNT